MLRHCLLFGLVLAAATPVVARADFQSGVAAYDRGDYGEALDQWLPLAQHDDLAAQRNVAQLYRLGKGIPQDYAKAAYWYQRAAENGLAAAQVNLAVLYLRGQGVRKDPAQAARWFARAAEAGHAVAQYNLGMMYESGTGVKRDPGRAMGWYYLAARNGEPGALKRLGELVPFDPLNPPRVDGGLPELTAALPPPAQSGAALRAQAQSERPAVPPATAFGVAPPNNPPPSAALPTPPSYVAPSP